MDKEGKNAIKLAWPSWRRLRNNGVRPQLHVLTYNVDNSMGTSALPEEVERWSLTKLRERLVKIKAKIVSYGRYVTFQMTEVVFPQPVPGHPEADRRIATPIPGDGLKKEDKEEWRRKKCVGTR